MSDEYAPPPGPPPSRGTNQQHHVQFAGSPGQSSSSSGLAPTNPFRSAHAQTQGPHQSSYDSPPAYEAPPGPPPTWHSEKKGPLPNDDYAPPQGAPPGYSSRAADYAAPPGPPPSHREDEPEPPPYDPWLAVPDSSILPPPPSISEERSPTANADYDDAAGAHAWCDRNPLWRPQQHSPQNLQRTANGDMKLTAPPNAQRSVALQQAGPGQTHVRTTAKCGDSIFLSDLPVYTASTRSPQTLYFEVKVISMGHVNRHGETDAGIALGFVAPPYPSWRLPGWERASLGVHGDDGRRYVDNSYGGQDFTQSFRNGDVVGIGVNFSPPVYQGGKNRVQVFFTRNGRKDGEWDLHEERDSAEDGGDVRGLEGEHDILASVGCFGAVEFEARFRRGEWLFRP